MRCAARAALKFSPYKNSFACEETVKSIGFFCNTLSMGPFSSEGSFQISRSSSSIRSSAVSSSLGHRPCIAEYTAFRSSSVMSMSSPTRSAVRSFICVSTLTASPSEKADTSSDASLPCRFSPTGVEPSRNTIPSPSPPLLPRSPFNSASRIIARRKTVDGSLPADPASELPLPWPDSPAEVDISVDSSVDMNPHPFCTR
mmetsp:Transcript_32152/g.96337  ORF Transcript_32152/g.96337 Transcript_32152/m.96337 type:complete len:200 (-) Transcript_32152:623-1222(-)